MVIMGERMTRLSCAWLTTVVLVGPFLTEVAVAGDNGVIFRLVATGDCATASPERVCLSAPLVSGAPTSALDVLRDIYPGLDANGIGHQFAGAEAVETASDPDAGTPDDREVGIATGDFANIAVIEAGNKAFAAAVSSGVVTVAEVKPAYRALGRLLVATDPGGPTVGYRLLLAAPDSPVALTLSSHFNSQEGFDVLHLTGVVGGELIDLYDGPYLYSLAEATEHCQLLDHREVISAIKTQPQSHHGLADIGVVVDYAATCINGETRRQLEAKSFPLRLTYDGARYDGDASALGDLNSGLME
ncbi:MAG: hypothetical protein H6Q99_2702 [Proteobacteria bacterium]|nr:hypothetical protein [Pseudomonadota bacterium]